MMLGPKEHADLITFLEGQIGQPFIWGVRDCNILAGRCLDIILGTRHTDQVVGKYRDAAAAAMFQASHCTFKEILIDEGAMSIDPQDCTMGDFLLEQAKGEPWIRAHFCVGQWIVGVLEKGGVGMAPKEGFLKIVENLEAFR